MSSGTNVRIRLYNRDYQVSCGQDQVEALQTSARYLDKKMLEVRGNSASMSIDRMAVLAGLNIAHELLELQNSAQSFESGHKSVVHRLVNRLEDTLRQARQDQQD